MWDNAENGFTTFWCSPSINNITRTNPCWSVYQASRFSLQRKRVHQGMFIIAELYSIWCCDPIIFQTALSEHPLVLKNRNNNYSPLSCLSPPAFPAGRSFNVIISQDVCSLENERLVPSWGQCCWPCCMSVHKHGPFPWISPVWKTWGIIFSYHSS